MFSCMDPCCHGSCQERCAPHGTDPHTTLLLLGWHDVHARQAGSRPDVCCWAARRAGQLACRYNEDVNTRAQDFQVLAYSACAPARHQPPSDRHTLSSKHIQRTTSTLLGQAQNQCRAYMPLHSACGLRTQHVAAGHAHTQQHKARLSPWLWPSRPPWLPTDHTQSRAALQWPNANAKALMGGVAAG